MNIFDMDKLSLPEQVQKNKEDIKDLQNLVGSNPNFTNPNLLINSNFKINQRAAASYSTVNKYTVDRWMLVSGSVTVESVGITLNGTIQQTLESAPDGDVSVSSNAGDISYANGIVTISTTTPTLILWAKLEIGTTKTSYCVPDDATELLKCQRYYERGAALSIIKWAMSTNHFYEATINFKVVKRTSPTITIHANDGTAGALYDTQAAANDTNISALFTNTYNTQVYNTANTLVTGHRYAGYYEADAEIY